MLIVPLSVILIACALLGTWIGQDVSGSTGVFVGAGLGLLAPFIIFGLILIVTMIEDKVRKIRTTS